MIEKEHINIDMADISLKNSLNLFKNSDVFVNKF